ncbi:hypothetical protein MBLNU13_g08048t1 [Cladosporium sp. NU13]
MPSARRKAHLNTADEALKMLLDAKVSIEESIEAHDAITDNNKEKIADGVEAVYENLPAVLGLFHDIQKQWSGAKLSDAVWLAAADDILRCHYACKDLHVVLRGAFTRASEGPPLSDRDRKFLALKGERAKELLGMIHGSMKRLEHQKTVTDGRLLNDLENALTPHRKSSADGSGSMVAESGLFVRI